MCGSPRRGTFTPKQKNSPPSLPPERSILKEHEESQAKEGNMVHYTALCLSGIIRPQLISQLHNEIQYRIN